MASFKSRDTVMKLWEPVVRMSKDPKSLSDARYGMGWAVLPKSHEHAFGRNQGRHVRCCSTVQPPLSNR